ncbi:MAG: hypothetical protein JWP89_6957 [Schlesneria sp.]|nr:hypothetical protein [Schlesneria sp.]
MHDRVRTSIIDDLGQSGRHPRVGNALNSGPNAIWIFLDVQLLEACDFQSLTALQFRRNSSVRGNIMDVETGISTSSSRKNRNF